MLWGLRALVGEGRPQLDIEEAEFVAALAAKAAAPDAGFLLLSVALLGKASLNLSINKGEMRYGRQSWEPSKPGNR